MAWVPLSVYVRLSLSAVSGLASSLLLVISGSTAVSGAPRGVPSLAVVGTVRTAAASANLGASFTFVRLIVTAMVSSSVYCIPS